MFRPGDNSSASGASVVLNGLQSRPELNGLQASVVGWVEDKGRYQVKVPGESLPLGVRPSNLRATRMDDDANAADTSNRTTSQQDGPVEDGDAPRECRCMFCGQELLCASEAEAVEHMSVCPALGEQLASRAPFTIPQNTMP